MTTTNNGIVMKLTSTAFGAIAKLVNGQEVRVSHRDYWRYLEAQANAPEGYECIPYMNSYHLIAIPNPIYVDEE